MMPQRRFTREFEEEAVRLVIGRRPEGRTERADHAMVFGEPSTPSRRASMTSARLRNIGQTIPELARGQRGSRCSMRERHRRHPAAPQPVTG